MSHRTKARAVGSGAQGAAWTALLAWALALGSLPLAAQDKPLLSEELRAAYQQGGAERVQQRYQEIVVGGRDAYQLDAEGVVALAAQYAQAGDAEAAQVFSLLGYELAMAKFEGSGMAAQLNAMLDSARREDEARAAKEVAPDPGPARDDLARFFGLYRDPDPGGAANRELFVTETCDGHLVFSGMWGNVAPFVMRSESDTRFVQISVDREYQPQAYQLDFEIGPDGRMAAMSHNLTAGFSFERWPRSGDLPDGWEECIRTDIRSPSSS
jgi:hypothetical protein